MGNVLTNWPTYIYLYASGKPTYDNDTIYDLKTASPSFFDFFKRSHLHHSLVIFLCAIHYTLFYFRNFAFIRRSHILTRLYCLSETHLRIYSSHEYLLQWFVI